MKKYHPIHSVNDAKFNTVDGQIINLKFPNPPMIHISDIAGALSKICRFGGHCREFYSVAQHSVLVAAMAPKSLKLEALLHDAPEAYLGDVIKPLKVMLGQSYAKIEDRFTQCIILRYGLSELGLEAIKCHDRDALTIESERLQQGEKIGWNANMLALGLPQQMLNPLESEILFLNAYKTIMSERIGKPILI